ncbi:elicitor-associated permease-like protein [Rossellomorea sp. NRS-1567]|uniref:elicitor-associated permease-like protein n=1 Tax=Rossellomorea sp. NRS-1567 TaxID=3233901 RepID=UPI003D2E6D43
MIEMNFIKYLTFKYKLTRHKSNRSKRDVLTEWIGIFILSLSVTAVLYFIINALSENIQGNMNTYIVGLFAFLCLISISSATKAFYKEYFLSPEREILLVAPIKNSQIILARFFIVAIEVLLINAAFLFPFILANYFAGNIAIEIVLMTIPQIIAGSIFFSALAHVLYTSAFLISKGKGLKAVAFSIMTLASVGVIAVIVYASNYKQYLLHQDEWLNKIFYLLLQYPEYLLENSIELKSVAIFTLLIILYASFTIPLVYFLTDHCYKKGLLTISLRDLDQSFYSNKASTFIHRYIQDHFIKKDLLYVLRTPKLFSVYVSPLLFTSVIEFKNQFASSGITLTILINIFALFITTVTLNILLSDDKNLQDLLFSIPFNYHHLYKMRSRLVHIISFLLAGSYLLIVMILEKVELPFIIYGLVQLFILTFISSKVFLSRIMKRNTKKYNGYKYNGEIVKPLFYYLFVWNIPLLIVFSILYEYYRRIIENHSLSVQAAIILTITIVVIIGMLYKSNKTTIKPEVNKLWQA